MTALLTAPVDITTPEQLREVMGADFVFSREQFEAITAPLEPAVIIAGAGSGKTTVMAARVVWLIATGRVSAHEILGLTFTTKATAELAGRIRDNLTRARLIDADRQRLVGAGGDDREDADEPTVATYHSYAANLLSEHGLRIGHEPDSRLIADALRYQLAGRAVQRHARPVQHLTDSPPHAIAGLLALDGQLSEHLVDPDTLRAHDAADRVRFEQGMAGESRKTYLERNVRAIHAIDRRAELLDLVEGYRSLKAQLGLVDFSDQISLAARLAEECPEVGEAERAKFKVVLLDEYQDTSVAQAMMLSRLFSGPDGDSGRGHAVTAVGDPNQAIYGWRGASVSNILDFDKDFPAREGRARRFTLAVNRRSDRRILQVANHLAADLYATSPDSGELVPSDDAGRGDVELAVHATWDEELDWLADRVREAREAMAEPSWRAIGVLTRDNAHAAAVFDRLSEREIPVEIVGLKGLLRLPEVAEVVATLSLVGDVTANADLLTLLSGARWAVGPRDLALLGRRSRELAGATRAGAGALPLETELLGAVDGADPTEIASLSDALEDPGDLPYSDEARARFGLLAEELRRLRHSAGEPILDLVRRIIDVTGIDVELASSCSPAAAARRDNLDLFVQAVSEFQGLDGQVTLAALLAWLEAEDEFGQGLDVATPSEADSVKLLTVHRAKGLEWHTVFLVGVCEGRFPTSQGRSTSVTVPHVLPTALRGDRRDLAALRGHTPADIEEFKTQTKARDAVEELRLAYVAWTRAKHRLLVSAWCFAPHRRTGTGPSAYARATREAMQAWGGEPERWQDCPQRGDANPYDAVTADLPWPISHHTPEVERRHAAAALLGEVRSGRWHPAPVDDLLVQQRIESWDAEIERLVAEASREQTDLREVSLPSSLSATALARLRDQPEELARDLVRPMPRPPVSQARFGTRFHAWVEARLGQQQLLLDPDDLPGRYDSGIEDDADLAALQRAFEEGEFAERAPHAVEAPFALVLGGQVVRGRIDAVYAEPPESGGGWLVVDWKTNRHETADPLQLAVYRLAWAELTGTPLEQVRAAFHYVRSGRTVEPAELPGRDGLETLLSGL